MIIIYPKPNQHLDRDRNKSEISDRCNRCDKKKVIETDKSIRWVLEINRCLKISTQSGSVKQIST